MRVKTVESDAKLSVTGWVTLNDGRNQYIAADASRYLSSFSSKPPGAATNTDENASNKPHSNTDPASVQATLAELAKDCHLVCEKTLRVAKETCDATLDPLRNMFEELPSAGEPLSDQLASAPDREQVQEKISLAERQITGLHELLRVILGTGLGVILGIFMLECWTGFSMFKCTYTVLCCLHPPQAEAV